MEFIQSSEVKCQKSVFKT